MKKDLRGILCCPSCHGGLQDKEEILYCTLCRKGYPVRAGIPDFLEE